ncbi:uncharacterized protein ARMOST_13100 [Armillaria ostoyae]|uniref:Uncharacterized protein n=1 Tax=Armillaria ostoyae TaxID=47428 RepID=A0A284RLU4_ARMOS|nr:uncharacterized protein ARMOST_13100 [Armillaria ostoyae]
MVIIFHASSGNTTEAINGGPSLHDTTSETTGISEIYKGSWETALVKRKHHPLSTSFTNGHIYDNLNIQ